MREYIFTLAAVAALTAVALSLSHTDMKGSTSTALGILVLCAVAAPIGGIAASLSDAELRLPAFDVGEEAGACEDEVARAFEDGVGTAIAERLGVKRESVEVGCDGFDMSRVRADKIYVRLTGAAALADPLELRRYVEENFTEGGECRVELVPW